jgi:GT2 family glycosyltransferase
VAVGVQARFGCVVLTQGRRPDDLRRALASVLVQRDVVVDLLVVGNGWQPAGLPDGVRGLWRPVDRGIPAGRNLGAAHVAGEILLFLDDDASLDQPDALVRLAARFADEPRLGAVQLRVEAHGPGSPAREWVPRLRVGDRTRSSDVTHVWEGAVAIRRSVFDAVGGWGAELRCVHEGTDLGWRVMDAGYRVSYAGDIAARHPPYTASNDWDHYFGARNRVWLARRYLPLPLGLCFVLSFAARAASRLDTRAKRAQALAGYRDGLLGQCPPRRALRARTLARMTRLGRPPIL